jgi:hypothetical protein
VVAVYTCLTWRQAKALRESNETNRQALEETRRSNKATEESNEIQRKAVIAANRAWLAPALDVRAPLKAGPIGLEVRLTNSGRFPATNIVGRSSFARLPFPLSEPSIMWQEPPAAPGPNSIAIVFPGASTTTTLAAGGPALSEDEVLAAKEGELFLYYSGIYAYHDGFERVCETRLFLTYNPATDSWDFTAFGNSAT